MPTEAEVARLLDVWRADPRSTYATWFLWEERLKNFRSIRRGIQAVVADMEAGTFGTAYRGSSLETVVHSIAEQRQIFRGADHAFLWKPKLRIPDIYESPGNQKAFAHFLRTCLCCSCDDALVTAIHALDAHQIKGLGPAVANLLYFLHPTIAAPSNTAIMRGFAALTGAPAKLGRWGDYLAMRQAMLRLTDQHRQQLSNDLGAIAGFLYDIGSGLLPVPAADGDHAAWNDELERIAAESRNLVAEPVGAADGSSHTAVQTLLRDLGRDLGFQVHIASNDRNRPVGASRLGDGCLADLPEAIRNAPGSDSVRLIDVLWIDSAGQVAAAFEVEHTTSIYSGIVRMLDLAMGTSPAAAHGLFLVAPDDREDEVRQQLARPAFQQTASLSMRYLPYGELQRHADAIRRFGSGLKPILAIAKNMNG